MRSIESVPSRAATRRQRWSFFLPEFVRYLLAGAINTAFTYLVYLALLLIVSYTVAFTFSYVIGILASYALNALFVFREKPRWGSAIRYPIVYLVQYLLSVLLLYCLVEKAHLSKATAPLWIVALSIPVSYCLTRYLIKPRAPSHG